jgi:hypothetical protein
VKRRGHSVIDQTAAVIIEGSFGARAEPPAELTARQQAIWREIVACEPIEFFATATCRNLLANLCRHHEAAEILSAAIDKCNAEQLRADEGVTLRMRAIEVKAATDLATRLRLTNQSRYNAPTASSNARNTVKGSKPWDRARAS